MVVAAFLSASGQLLWKLSGAALNWQLIAGFACYGLGALLMIVAFRFGSFSVLHPINALSYVVALVYGIFLLKEPFSPLSLLAVACILVGVTFIGGGDA